MKTLDRDLDVGEVSGVKVKRPGRIDGRRCSAVREGVVSHGTENLESPACGGHPPQHR